MKGVFERLRPRLRTFRDERGRELFDVPGAPLSDRSAPAPVRFLPEYDNVLLAHDDRSRIGPPGLKGWTEVGWGSVLVDGFGAARWKAELDRDRSTLWVEPFGKVCGRPASSSLATTEKVVPKSMPTAGVSNFVILLAYFVVGRVWEHHPL